MTIKSDRWIRRQCIPPEYELTQGGKTVTLLSPPYTSTEEGLIKHWNHRHADTIPGQGVTAHENEPIVWPFSGDFQPMIEPFEAEQVRYKYLKGLDEVQGKTNQGMGLDIDGDVEKVISYGNSSYGYDARCADEFKIFTNINSAIVDPKNFSEDCLVDHKGPYCIIPPNSFALARTVEYFRIPEDVLVVCLGKSTYARCGIIVNVTPLEPGWEGHVTLEFSNTTNLPAKVYANEGVCQFLFFQSDERCDVSYKDRGGKYMGQRGVTNPRM